MFTNLFPLLIRAATRVEHKGAVNKVVILRPLSKLNSIDRPVEHHKGWSFVFQGFHPLSALLSTQGFLLIPSLDTQQLPSQEGRDFRELHRP